MDFANKAGSVKSSPAVAGDVVYVGGEDGNVYAFGLSALVAPSVSASPSTVDQGQTSVVSMTAAAASGGTPSYTYQWFMEIPNGTSYAVGSGSNPYNFITAASTIIGIWNFILQVTDSTGAALNSTSVSVTVNATPTVSVTPVGPVTMDVGQSELFTCAASGGTGALSYQWYLGGGAVSGAAGTGSTYTFTPASEGSPTIYCTVTDSANAPVTSVSNTVSIIVNPVLTVSITPASWNMNVDMSTTFTAIPSGGSGTYTNYQWYVNGSLDQSGASPVMTFTPAYYSPPAGTFSITVTVTDSLGAISTQSTPATATVIVSAALGVYLLPSLPMSVAATATGGTGIYTYYQWYINGSFTSQTTTDTFTPYSPGTGTYTYWITVTVTDSSDLISAPSNAVKVTVYVSPLVAPTLSVSPWISTNQGGTLNLAASSASGGIPPYSYQ